MPAAARRVRRERGIAAAQEPVLRLDRAADCGIPLVVQRIGPLAPVGRRLRAVGEEAARAARVARQHLDVLLVRRIADLREPEAALLDEIDREPVRPGRDRAAQRQRLPQRLARRDGTLERRPRAVPDDRVATLVEPVVGEEEPLLDPARAPGRGAGVLDLDGRLLQRARLDGLALETAPARDEWAGGRVMAEASLGTVTRPLLVRAALREPVERTPVWFMRQAGRSLPEYRAIRERHGFFDVAGTPELCAEVTLQPVRRHGVDAAVMFADIMSPVLGMGVALELVEGVGPVIEHPVATLADVERLRVTEPDEWAGPILEAVRIVRARARRRRRP